MVKSKSLKVLILTPHYDSEPTPHCARINDLLAEINRKHPQIELTILSISSLKGGRFSKFKYLLKNVKKMIVRSDVVHIVGYLPAFPFFRLQVGRRPLIVGPNITGTSFPKFFLNNSALNALRYERPFHWIKWYLLGGALREFINVQFTRGATNTITLSEYASEIIASRGYPREKLQVIPFAAPFLEGKPKVALPIKNSTIPSIVYIGRLDRRKGFDTFLNLVHNYNGSARFYVFGDGPLRIDAEKLSLENEQLILCGKMKRAELLKHLRSMDLLIQPSTYEAISTTIFEALRAGVPVLSANISAHLEAAQSLPGISIFSEADMEDAQLKLVNMIDNLPYFKAQASIASSLLELSFATEWIVDLYTETANSKRNKTE